MGARRLFLWHGFPFGCSDMGTLRRFTVLEPGMDYDAHIRTKNEDMNA